MLRPAIKELALLVKRKILKSISNDVAATTFEVVSWPFIINIVKRSHKRSKAELDSIILYSFIKKIKIVGIIR